jgi:hypothetical protein
VPIAMLQVAIGHVLPGGRIRDLIVVIVGLGFDVIGPARRMDERIQLFLTRRSSRLQFA